MAQAKKQTKPKSNIMTYLIVLVIAIAVGFFWFTTKDDSKERYAIKSANGDHFYKEQQYINLTGEAAEEKKIKLSEDYWTNGKFDFK